MTAYIFKFDYDFFRSAIYLILSRNFQSHLFFCLHYNSFFSWKMKCTFNTILLARSCFLMCTETIINIPKFLFINGSVFILFLFKNCVYILSYHTCWLGWNSQCYTWDLSNPYSVFLSALKLKGCLVMETLYYTRN